MLLLIAGLLLFLGIHSLSIVNEPLRDRLAQRLGVVGWQAVYALIAIVGFILIIQGYAAARIEPVLARGADAYVFFRHDEDGGMALHAEDLFGRLGGFSGS